MTLRTRLKWAIAAGGAWFMGIAPMTAEQIHLATLEGPAPFSVEHVRDRLNEEADTGHHFDVEAVTEALGLLSSLQKSEAERIGAMWAILDADMIAEAQKQLTTLPPLIHAVDPRFFEPVNPALITRIIEVYGFSVTPLAEAKPSKKRLNLDQRDQLMIMLSAVHNQLITPREAEALMQGALDLLAFQSERMWREKALRVLMTQDSAG